MDGTVIPLETGEARAREIREFQRLLAQHSNILVAYVTGRHLELGLAGVAHYELPMPDVFVCDVGTSIHWRATGKWDVDEKYRHQLLRSWNGRTNAEIGVMLATVPGLSAQEQEKQGEFKRSYYAARARDHREIVRLIHERLAGNGVRTRVIYSVDAKKNIALVDVLPEIAAKDAALAYLWEKLGLEKDRVVYAGDSGNDLLAFVSGFNAIVVNNTPAPVKEEVRRQMREKGIAARIFFAPSNYVQGVMEGCFHFKIFRP
jgi:HAD superfamily hydrolase (TIGR01484 family)